MPDRENIDQFGREGYTVVRGLFTHDEVDRYIDHYMALRAAGKYWGDFAGVDLTSADPLRLYPRMIHMHRWDTTSLDFLLDVRINAVMTAILGAEPYAVQTMIYFKPAGGRGQALHQDQAYLRVQPGTCAAAWLALDKCDEENGCMQVVPGTHTLPLLCTQKADTSQSFTDVTVPLAEGMHPVPVMMDAGDVLFFNGQLVHGSLPNVSHDRFRRSLIGHYIVGDAEKVGGFYHPVLRMDGTVVDLGESEGGGPCGVWRNADGTASLELILPAEPPPAAGHE
ncbi:MAG: phytanoyl-CoA dioxygenase family protein [Capsulimonadaceae bacterium]